MRFSFVRSAGGVRDADHAPGVDGQVEEGARAQAQTRHHGLARTPGRHHPRNQKRQGDQHVSFFFLLLFLLVSFC